MEYPKIRVSHLLIFACAVFVRQTAAFPVTSRSLQPLQTCACKEEAGNCYKPKDAKATASAAAGSVVACQKAKCSSYKCDYAGTLRCMGVKLPFVLERIDVMKCRKKTPARTFLVPIDVDSTRTLPKPKTFNFRFAGGKRW